MCQSVSLYESLLWPRPGDVNEQALQVCHGSGKNKAAVCPTAPAAAVSCCRHCDPPASPQHQRGEAAGQLPSQSAQAPRCAPAGQPLPMQGRSSSCRRGGILLCMPCWHVLHVSVWGAEHLLPCILAALSVSGCCCRPASPRVPAVLLQWPAVLQG